MIWIFHRLYYYVFTIDILIISSLRTGRQLLITLFQSMSNNLSENGGDFTLASVLWGPQF